MLSDPKFNLRILCSAKAFNMLQVVMDVIEQEVQLYNSGKSDGILLGTLDQSLRVYESKTRLSRPAIFLSACAFFLLECPSRVLIRYLIFKSVPCSDSPSRIWI